MHAEGQRGSTCDWLSTITAPAHGTDSSGHVENSAEIWGREPVVFLIIASAVIVNIIMLEQIQMGDAVAESFHIVANCLLVFMIPLETLNINHISLRIF